jgi:hypothetical protein
MPRAVLVLFAAVATASALVTAFHLDPLTAAMSSKAGPVTGVSQVVTICFDSLTYPAYVEGFFGAYGQGGEYKLNVLTYPGGNAITVERTGRNAGDHRWALFDSLNVLYPESIVKGKQLEFRFTRTGDSIQYHTRQGTEYLYGFMRVGGREWVRLDFRYDMPRI